jgi:hypothetical protein
MVSSPAISARRGGCRTPDFSLVRELKTELPVTAHEVTLWRTSEGPIADEIAEVIGMPPERLVPRLEAAMTSFLKLRGNQRIVVDRALVEAAKDWHRIPIHRLPAPEPADKCALARGHL